MIVKYIYSNQIFLPRFILTENITEYTYFKHGTLSRSPSDELLLVDG